MIFLKNVNEKKIFLNDFYKKLDECLDYVNHKSVNLKQYKSPIIRFEKNLNDFYNHIEANFNVHDDSNVCMNRELFIHTLYFMYKCYLSDILGDELCFFDRISEIFDEKIDVKKIIRLSDIRAYIDKVLELVKLKYYMYNKISFKDL